MVYSLKGRNVLVTGASRGLGEAVCIKFAEAGSNVAINYVSSAEKAQTLATKLEKEHGVKAIAIQADMGKEADCIKSVKETISQLGGIDIIVSNAGYTRFSDINDLNAPTVEDLDLCYAVNVKAQLYLMREAGPTFKANSEGGQFIMSSSVAGIKTSGSSLAYSVTKAAQLHLMKLMATSQGPKIRVNAILPGLLLTDWGLLYPESSIEIAKNIAKLKKVTDIDECAQTYIDIATNSSMTGQQISVDSGLGLGLP